MTNTPVHMMGETCEEPTCLPSCARRKNPNPNTENQECLEDLWRIVGCNEDGSSSPQKSDSQRKYWLKLSLSQIWTDMKSFKKFSDSNQGHYRERCQGPLVQKYSQAGSIHDALVPSTHLPKLEPRFEGHLNRVYSNPKIEEWQYYSNLHKSKVGKSVDKQRTLNKKAQSKEEMYRRSWGEMYCRYCVYAVTVVGLFRCIVVFGHPFVPVLSIRWLIHMLYLGS